MRPLTSTRTPKTSPTERQPRRILSHKSNRLPNPRASGTRASYTRASGGGARRTEATHSRAGLYNFLIQTFARKFYILFKDLQSKLIVSIFRNFTFTSRHFEKLKTIKLTFKFVKVVEKKEEPEPAVERPSFEKVSTKTAMYEKQPEPVSLPVKVWKLFSCKN